MNVVAFDPSIETAGAACVADGGSRLVNATLIRTDRGERWDTEDSPEVRKELVRVMQLAADVGEWLSMHRPSLIVVEFPARTPRPAFARGFKARSALTLPSYGIAVGVIVATASAWRDQRRNAGHPCEILDVAADAWTRGYPATANDPHKTARVRLVESLYALAAGSLGCATLAGNVADAVLLARHHAMGTDHLGYVPGVCSGNTLPTAIAAAKRTHA